MRISIDLAEVGDSDGDGDCDGDGNRCSGAEAAAEFFSCFRRFGGAFVS
jgi:hypothetical protein